MSSIDRSVATKSLRGKVVVITGASSGLGRALAVAFAREGACVVLTARDVDRLEQTAKACRAIHGEALVVVTDVTQEDQVKHLTEQALRLKGAIDVWVNNAGVTLFAPLASGSFEEHRRVIETNLYGPMLAARAVMPIFKRQGHGVLINVGSVLSKIGHPFVPSYAISKFALRGLSEALRVEFADDPHIHICTALPYTMNTPHFESGANRIGLRARTMPPDQLPEKVAREIVDLAKHPRRELLVPRVAALGFAVHALLPETTEALLLHALERWHFDRVPEKQGTGNLFGPNHQQDGAEDGVHGHRAPRLAVSGLLLWALGDLLVPSSVRRAWRSVRGPLGEQAAAQ